MKCEVVKRNGNREEFDQGKLEEAIEGAFDGHINDDIEAIVDDVLAEILNHGEQSVSTEAINNLVEKSLMRLGFYNEARNFIIYREEVKNIKTMSVDNDTMSEYIFVNRYSRYLPRKRRRETWNEAVDRVRDMHLRKYPEASDELYWAFEQVRQKRVLPSMRSLQFGGEPIEKTNARIYNCSYAVADRIDFFSETTYLLLSGCGVGFSVEFENVNKLPSILNPSMLDVRHVTIDDSIEGWADAIKEIITSYAEGYTVEFIYKKIRKEGSKIRSGGKAPGHVPLRKSIEKIRGILDGAVGRKLKPIEAYDITMHIADCVISGGVRRSACIALFSPDDGEMMTAKTGEWFKENPQRARSNNSVKLDRATTTKDQFMRLFEAQKEFGEPGFLFVSNMDMGVNPCAEISLNPYLEKGYVMTDGTVVGEKVSGFAFCNLTTMNGVMLQTKEDFKNGVRASTIIGTCQAGYTDFDYLSKVSAEICKREALLGVSITGMMDSPDIALDPDLQREMAKYAIEVNKEISDLIGINSSARITCVKPEGCFSLETNIRTSLGDRSFKDIFNENGYSVKDIEGMSKAFLPLINDLIIYNENNEEELVTKLFVNGLNELVEFSLEDGSTLRCTPWHKFKLTTGIWKRADELDVDDDIQNY